MKKKVIVYNRLEQPVLEKLQEKYDVHYFKSVDTKKDPMFLKQLKEVEGIIGLELPVDRELLDRAPNLKIISNVSVGYNNLDMDEIRKRNIMATNTPGVLTDTVADAIFGLLVATARRIPELNQYVKNGKWTTETLDAAYFGLDVHHKKIGIIGMGRIGKAIAKRAHYGFDMEVLYHSRSRKPDVEESFSAVYCSLEDLLNQSDFVCLITPLTPETQGMIGINQFKQMKETAVFINGSRGKTIVEKDLINALRHGKIAGAGLDVFDKEPIDSDNPLLKMDNVVATPHIGSSTYETELNMSKLAAHNLEEGLQGRIPPNLIQ